MAFSIGDIVRIKEGGIGTITQVNGHAYKISGKWYHQDEVEARPDPVEADILGWHIFYWKEGQMKICFRPGGHFHCKEHPAAGTWHIFDGELLIDWQDKGRYALSVVDSKQMYGYALPKDDSDPKNWRKTIYFGALNPVEKLLIGDGEGTEWNLKGKDVDLSIEFRADGENHFVCSAIPGDAHWSLDKRGKTVLVDWGKNGKYELEVNVSKKSMDGYHLREGITDSFDCGDEDVRKAEFKGNLKDPKEIVHDGDDEGHGHGHGHSHGDGHGHTHGEGHGSHDFGGGIVGLGNLTLASEKFMVDREGQVDKGFKTTFGFERVGAGKATGFKAWVQDSNGQKISDQVEGDSHDDHCHFTVMPKADDAAMFAVSCGDQVSTISVHPGAAPTNDGIMSVLEDGDGNFVGFIELKLHDDAGDLELWLCKDGAMEQPLDFPADTTITVTCATKDNKTAQLNVRDNDRNEDEDGKPNMRNGKTNYFVFPGESDQDPEWLVGEDFRSTTTVTFTAGGKTYIAPPFVLVPHQH